MIVQVGIKYGLFKEYKVAQAGNGAAADLHAFREEGRAMVLSHIMSKDKLKQSYQGNVIVITTLYNPGIQNSAKYYAGYFFDTSKITKEELKTFEIPGKNIQVTEIASSDWYIYLHCGEYQRIPGSWKAAINGIKQDADGLGFVGGLSFYEHYLNYEKQNAPKSLRTLLAIGIKKL